MVLYFSATGNTEYIAQEIAKRLDDECVNLLHRIKSNDHTPLYSEKRSPRLPSGGLLYLLFFCAAGGGSRFAAEGTAKVSYVFKAAGIGRLGHRVVT